MAVLSAIGCEERISWAWPHSVGRGNQYGPFGEAVNVDSVP